MDDLEIYDYRNNWINCPNNYLIFTDKRKFLFMICCSNSYRFNINTIYRPRSKKSDLDILFQEHRGWQIRALS